MKHLTLILLVLTFSCNTKKASQSTGKQESNTTAESMLRASDLIRINQLGYFPGSTKVGSLVGVHEETTFAVIDLINNKEVLTGELGKEQFATLSGENIRQIDFSDLQAVGSYQIRVGSKLYSHPFEIGRDIYDEALYLVTKSYYYQRAGMEITEKHGGQWKRLAGHPDQEVHYHEQCGKTGTISSPKGWYDAGDYGKYVSNGAFSAGQLLYTLERFATLYPDGALNIPESGNGINDLLDELKYEADWIATMQDIDGGVFHKLTTKRFSGAIMPHEGKEVRFVMPKSTVATFDFAAILAKMARCYESHDAEQSASWLKQARQAWNWGVQNPTVQFRNPPDVFTGMYGDSDASEEQFWAAAELYITTGEEQYLDFVVHNVPELVYTYGGGWKNFMEYLGVFSLLHAKINLPENTRREMKDKLLQSANELVNRVQTFDYQQGVNDFKWGSNSDVQNIAFIIGEAHRIQPQQEYADAVFSTLDYLFGHNATGYSMVTGIGDKPPMNVHHRPSKADGIEAPVPGFVCGGPNFAKQDTRDVDYPDGVSPMHSYKDVWESYASNEVCLNWNAPTPYLLQFAIEEGQR